MPLEDPNHTRRSLVVTSMAFIAFSLGGGHIKDNSLSLPLVNIEFEHVWVLAILVWFALFWFCFRYWQDHWTTYKDKRRENFKNIVVSDPTCISLMTHKLGKCYVLSSYSSVDKTGFLFSDSLSPPPWYSYNFKFPYTLAVGVKEDYGDNTRWDRLAEGREVQDQLATIKSMKLKFHIFRLEFVRYNTISSMFAPFWLFLAAVASGAYRVWESISHTIPLSW